MCFALSCASKPKIEIEKKKNPNPSAQTKEKLGPFGLKGEGTLIAEIMTSDGPLICTLFEKEAPHTVANFVGLAQGKKTWVNPEGITKTDTPFYDGLSFFRIVPGFFLQSGDPLNTGKGGPGYTFDDEVSSSLKHDSAGVLSMANRGPNTNGSQFFILLRPTPHLDGHHSVFGKCDSQEIIRKLSSYPVNAENIPLNPPTIIRIRFFRKNK